MDANYLGSSMPKLGFGLMRLPMKDGAIDLEQTKNMVDTFMERGFTYFDTAYVYINGTSEVAAREALVKRYPRESFQLATKLPLWPANNTEEMEKIFATSLERTGVEYFDFYLLHNLNADSAKKADKLDAWGFIAKKKAEGKIRHIGFSFHDTPELLENILKAHPEAEFVQLQINYADWEAKNVQSHGCYETAMKYNKPVIVMEPIKGGSLTTLREDISKPMKDFAPGASLASWAIRYSASLDGIITVLSGMSNTEQLEDNTAFMKDFKPLNNEEYAVIDEVNKLLMNVPIVPCTDCKYCVEDCPMLINVPGAFVAYNNYMSYNNLDISKWLYKEYMGDKGKAGQCIECGACEAHCPQHIKIREMLKNAASAFE
jgi:hypothetical protein